MNLTELKEWKDLSSHKNSLQNFSMRQSFEEDKERFTKFSIKFEDILFDYSKNLITQETLDLLVKLANSMELGSKIEALFSGKEINITENRAVLHTALRQSNSESIFVSGEDVIPKVHNELNKIEAFVKNVHSGKFLGATGKRLTDIVNIGIGSSDLGPAMVTEALSYYKNKDINSYFVSNVDGSDIITTLSKINPETTLFIVASKTFTTQETMTNAFTAKKWLLENLTQAESAEIISNHFVAISTNIKACAEFGISEDRIFQFWDWVGGRYSLWSSIGLSIALSIGMDNFRKLLAGAEAMDKHFRNTSFDKNIPVLMALLGVWYINFWGASSHCVVPYDYYLTKFPLFLQQLDMESNGKEVQIDGEKVNYSTAPIVWGAAGTNAQHSFFQLIHQGTHLIPADFIAFINNLNQSDQQTILLSNFFAQTEALMRGKNSDEVIKELKAENLSEDKIKDLQPHKVFKGNKPTNSILIKKLTPYNLGSLIAMYEHKVFVQGVIWNINSFDQWGVELGKQLAKKILKELTAKDSELNHDSSTVGLISFCKTQSEETI